jgi:hypothetical protein
MTLAMYRQGLLFFPELDGADITPQIRGDRLPGIELIILSRGHPCYSG